MSVILFVLSFASCAPKPTNGAFAKDYSIENQAQFIAKNGTYTKDKLSGRSGAMIDIAFPEPTEVNTLVLYEKGENIMEFEIFAKQGGEYKQIYKQDKVGSFRYCAFETVETNVLRLVINKVRDDGEFSIENIDVLNAKHERSDFRVTAYGIIQTILDPANVDPAHFEVITDFILFEAAVFDKNGDIKFNDKELSDGTVLDGKEALKIGIKNVKAAAGDDIKLYLNLFGPNAEGEISKEDMHTATFEKYSDKIAQQIKTLLEELDLDGVYFDYEHPTKKSSWSAYSDFLITVGQTIGDKKIGIAIPAWGGSISNRAKEEVDYIEIMGYDWCDYDGYHASFASGGGAEVFDFAMKKGYDISKCTLGVPFYSRGITPETSERSAGYSGYYDKLGKYGNLYCEDDGTAMYGNGYQMIYDKAAFAYDTGAGGVMVWHYSCDVRGEEELSLFNAIGAAIKDRA